MGKRQVEALTARAAVDVEAFYDTRAREAEAGAESDLLVLRPDPTADTESWREVVTASVVDDAATVITTVFDEAERRDPSHARRWVALVDGYNHQIDRIEEEAQTRGVDVAIVVDLIHVLDYLWGAVWCFSAEDDPAAQAWVHDRALAVLGANARRVAGGIKGRAAG